MTPELMQFFGVMAIASWLISLIASMLFFKTLSEKDFKIINTPDSKDKLSLHTGILAGIVYIADYCFFIHTAIVVAMLLVTKGIL